MIQCILNSRHFVACLLAAATGMLPYFKLPFPPEKVFLQVTALRVQLVRQGLFTTPYMAYSIPLSGLYVFGLTFHKRIHAGKLPPYPDPNKRDDLFLVVGEIHNQRKPTLRKALIGSRSPSGHSSQAPQSSAQSVPERRAAACTLSLSRFSPTASDKNKRIGGLVLEVKGDFCHKVQEILDRHGRADDYVEIGLGSEYRYNPLHNDLDAYALAYNIASLLKTSSAGARNRSDGTRTQTSSNS